MSSQKNFILVNPPSWVHFKPLSWTRPIAEFRFGILTIKEKWERKLGEKVSHFCKEKYLQELYPTKIDSDNFLISGDVIPDSELIQSILSLELNQSIFQDKKWIASRMPESAMPDFMFNNHTGSHTEFRKHIQILQNLWQIFQENGEALQTDFLAITNGRHSQEIPTSNKTIGNDIFIEEGAKLEHCIINSSAGPIYIGAHAEIMEGAMIRGGLALCDHAQIKMGAKIYGATTIGPYCKVGGEINNSILFGFSNKAHDGFLGNAVLGEWCNLGADTNNSNLKNNYEPVKLWSYESNRFEKTGTNFCGLIMGDHAKCGINTMFNTGTVVGVGANVFGEGYPVQFIPDFAWGGATGFSTFHLDKFFETAEIVLSRRSISLDEPMRNMLTQVFEQTLPFRHWEKAV